jgi:hypothetical protein
VQCRVCVDKSESEILVQIRCNGCNIVCAKRKSKLTQASPGKQWSNTIQCVHEKGESKMRIGMKEMKKASVERLRGYPT